MQTSQKADKRNANLDKLEGRVETTRARYAAKKKQRRESREAKARRDRLLGRVVSEAVATSRLDREMVLRLLNDLLKGKGDRARFGLPEGPAAFASWLAAGAPGSVL